MSKGEVTRQRIIEQAAPIFNQRGYAGCSMQDVMDATGLEKGGLYRHFTSKEELAVEAFRYSLARSVKIRTERLAETEGAMEKLRLYIRRFVEEPSATPGGCPLMNTAIDADDGNPLLRRLVCQGMQDWKARLSRIVEEGIERGEIRRDVEPRRIATTVIAALEGALMISRLEGNNGALQDTQASLQIVLDAIEAD
jgi:TetR/AcrR family transcriptional regulator, transcriptional repressor for nem operon